MDTSPGLGHEPLKEEILTQVLCAGPRVFRSDVYGVELELQEGSLEQDVKAVVTISPQLRFVVCRTECQGSSVSQELLATTFVSGPEGVVFREDKPALLRFHLGMAEDFLSEDVTKPQNADMIIETTLREWYSPLSSPDGTEDWMPLGSYYVKYRKEGKYREVWVETPLQHFSIFASGFKEAKRVNTYDKDSTKHYYYEPISRLPKIIRARATNKIIRFYNETEKTAIFTSWPIVQNTDAVNEVKGTLSVATGLVEGTVGRRTRAEVRGAHLTTFQDPITTVVSSGMHEDIELPYDIKAHRQMHVRVGVLKDLSSDEPDAPGKLQLLDEKRLSGNHVLGLLPARLRAPSHLPTIPWPCNSETIKTCSVSTSTTM